MRELENKSVLLGKKGYYCSVNLPPFFISFFVVTVLFARFGNSSERTESRLFNSYFHSHMLIKMRYVSWTLAECLWNVYVYGLEWEKRDWGTV